MFITRLFLLLIITLLIAPSVVQSAEYSVEFLAYPSGTKVVDSNGRLRTSISGHIFVAFYENGSVSAVKGFGPDGRGFFTASELKDEKYLVQHAKVRAKFQVSERQYNRAIQVTKKGYFVGVNDCVSYAADVAEALGLERSKVLDFVVLPVTYVKILRKLN
jgi:hypothetical protein